VVHVQPPVGVLREMVTLRVHLDDCGEADGPLRVVPGSHTELIQPEAVAGWRERVGERVLTARRGDVVVMRPLMLHASSQAVSPRSRRVLHLECARSPLAGGLRWRWWV